MKTIEELENEIKNLSQELENLKKEKENKRWRGSLNQRYYYISTDTSCCFTQETIEKLEIYNQLKDLALKLNEGEKIDWTNMDQYKYSIFYDHNFRELDFETNIIISSLGQIYCLDKNFLDIAKQEIGEENLLKLFKED